MEKLRKYFFTYKRIYIIFILIIYYTRIAPFDIYMKELTIYGVKVNPFSFPKAMGLLEAMGDR